MSNQDLTDKPLPLSQILEEEYIRLHGELPSDYKKLRDKTINIHGIEEEPQRSQEINRILVPEIYKLIHALPAGEAPAALCLSGGGIRSATFALGIIQGLASSGLLDKFDYLSTVSGGGYIGSWLIAWIFNRWQSPGEKTHDRVDSLKEVQELLAKPTKDPLKPEPQEICHLRAYSHYLNPRVGFLSADTWTLAGTYLRNLLINWTVLIPLLAAVLMIPRLCAAVIRIAPTWLFWLEVVALVLGLLSGALAILYMGVNRPTTKPPPFWESRRDQGSFLRWCLLPLIVSGVCLTTYWAWAHQLQAVPVCLLGCKPWFIFTIFGFSFHIPGLLGYSWFVFMIFGCFFHILGWLGYSLWLGKRIRWEFWVVAGSGVLGGWLAWLGVKIILPESIPGMYVCLALPLFLSAFLVAATLFVGLVSRFTDDEDREFYARAGSWMLIMIVCWSGISSLVIFGPLALLKSPWLLGFFGGTSGLISTIFGWSAKTAASKEKPQTSTWQTFLVNKGMVLAASAFILILIASLSLGTSWLLNYLLDHKFIEALSPPSGLPNSWYYLKLDFPPSWKALHLQTINSTPLGQGILICLGSALLGLLISRAMNINKFSLHAMYRNRLIRAFLGASHAERKPNPFTGFDPTDNIEMYKLLPQKHSWAGTQGNKLLPIVNITLNLVKGQDLAWQQRKAESFTASPLHCGSHSLGYRKSTEYGKFTREYGKYTNWLHAKFGGKSSQNGGDKDPAITLGTAMTISGAAVSPNMGYHSSPVISFLLTWFNLRLGAWLGNPGEKGKETYLLSQPRSAIRSMLAEAFGLTDENSPFVYLSDGGHFENLGLYEMVLRRCRFIIVSDASCDPRYAFEDLGNAIHKIRVDLGVPIEFKDGIHIYPWSDKEQQNPRKNCAIGIIQYSAMDRSGQDGVLIYLKPVICGDEPVDVLNYSKSNDKFPNESTGDQFFNETQFESYRMLGLHTIEAISKGRASTFEAFAKQVRDYLKKR
jgi:patatin-like phospholipase